MEEYGNYYEVHIESKFNSTCWENYFLCIFRARLRKEIFEFSDNNIHNDNILNRIRIKLD